MSMSRPSRSLINGTALLIVVIAALAAVTMCSRGNGTGSTDTQQGVELTPDTLKALSPDTTARTGKRTPRAPKPPKVYPERSPLDDKL